MSFKGSEFEAVAPLSWRERFGSINGIAAQIMATAIGCWAKEAAFKGECAHFIEHGDDGKEMDAALRRWYDDESKRAFTRMSRYPVVMPKGKARGLEAADFLAWHWNKSYADRLASVKPRSRHMSKDLTALVNVKSDIVQVNLFSGEELEKFLTENGCARTLPS